MQQLSLAAEPQHRCFLGFHGRACAAQDPAKTFLSTTNVHGTPQYMAPEQFAGAHCDEKVDVFALATILNECATRRPPWRDFGNAFQVSTINIRPFYCRV